MMGLSEAMSMVRGRQNQDISYMKNFLAVRYPDTIRALRIIDIGTAEKMRGKGYNLYKRENKKYKFLYYVRYYHNGQMLPNGWNTHTTSIHEAEAFAKVNRERLIEAYLGKHDSQLYKSLAGFYDKTNYDSSVLSERCRKEYGAVIKNRFIPFLKSKRISSLNMITRKDLCEYQESLINLGMRPQTVNNNFKPVKRLIESLARKGSIKENAAIGIRSIPIRQKDKKPRGCHEIDKLKGIFNKRWKDKESQLLAMLIYTTGMRNSEIKRFRLDDIIKIERCHFIRINESKTTNGIRLVPLHELVYKKLTEWVPKNKKGLLFEYKTAEPFTQANLYLGKLLGFDVKDLDEANITFYSGRHFWKTLMNAEGLGEDIEEVFMGHRVSSNVAKLYNHKDKIGQKNILKKAKQVFAILDRCIFIK